MKKGFTLIELLVVIAIIGVLSSIVISSMNQARAKGRYTKTILDMKEMEKAAIMDFDSYNSWAPDVGPAGNPRFVPSVLASWPTPQCSGWTYDWENWGSTIRISLRKVSVATVYYYCIWTSTDCTASDGTPLQNVSSKSITCNE